MTKSPITPTLELRNAALRDAEETKPKMVDFSRALERLKEGKYMAREVWKNGQHLRVTPAGELSGWHKNQFHAMALFSEDAMAKDWHEVEEVAS